MLTGRTCNYYVIKIYMSQRISQNEIQGLQQDVLNILAKIEPLKYRINTQDHRQLVNHLQYTLTTLRNMSNTVHVEQSDPYNSSHLDYAATSASGQKLVYNPDGTTRIVNSATLHTTGEGWESQFDESTLMKPPCFMVPPQNVTGLRNIRQASEFRRVADLTQQGSQYRQ